MAANPPQWHTGVYAQTSGQYLLKRRGDLVSAVLATRAAPLPLPATLFTLPPAYRPPFLLWRDVAGRVVQADGSPDPAFPEPYPFRLWILPDGTVRQHWQAAPAIDERYLAYEMNVTWGTTPAANDHAVLALLDEHWFGTAVLSAMPPKEEHRWQVPYHHPYWDWDFGRKERRKPDDWTPIARMTARATFNDRGRVAELYLSGPFFADMPSELGQLGHLEHLTLIGRYYSDYESGIFPKHDTSIHNQIYYHTPGPGLTGPIPPELGLLTRLQTLSLTDNGLRGPIPPELGQLSNLTYLFLHRNHLVALPPELGQLSSLQWLNLTGNQLPELLPELGQLQRLHSLFAGYNWLTSLPPELGQLQALTNLILNNNSIATVPPELGTLAELESGEFNVTV
ncbi:MAG: hypothetical protein OXG36_06855 [Caldilineaceae bacterium]|nr:hypothetical protein [Caldilineaceae bacterium]